MTKIDVVQHMYDELGISKKEASDILETMLDIMKDTLVDGEIIKISGFGNFVLKNKRVRRGRNPKTGEPMIITARRVLTFRPSHILRNTINNGT